LVWGGPQGPNRGFHKTIDNAAKYLDSAAAARSIGNLRHSKGWKSIINSNGLVSLPRSEATKLLANRPKPANQSPVIPIPPPVVAAPKPVTVETAVPLEPVHQNGHHAPAKQLEVKPPITVDPPVKVLPPILPSAPKEKPVESVMAIVASMAQDYRDFETAISLAEEARANIMRKMEQVQNHMSGKIASIKP